MITVKIKIKTAETKDGPATTVEAHSVSDKHLQPGETRAMAYVAAGITYGLEQMAKDSGQAELVVGTEAGGGFEAQKQACKRRNGVK